MKNHSYRTAVWTFLGVTLVHGCAVLAMVQFSVSRQDIVEPSPPVLVAKLAAESRPLATVTPDPSPTPKPISEPKSTPKPEVKPKPAKPKPGAKLEPKPEPELASKPNEAEVAAQNPSPKMPESVPQTQTHTQAHARPDADTLILPRVEAHGRGNAQPAYPVMSKRLKEEGEVLLKIRILIDGSVTDIQIQRSSGHARLDEAALAAVQHWRYQPASVNGQAIDYDYVQPIEFKLY